jgi:hypothetical protein
VEGRRDAWGHEAGACSATVPARAPELHWKRGRKQPAVLQPLYHMISVHEAPRHGWLCLVASKTWPLHLQAIRGYVLILLLCMLVA